jgi:hypothetical protein
MFTNHPTAISRSPGAKRIVAGSFLLAMGLLTAGDALSQETIGVPYIGRNHLSLYTTDLSRDGIGQERVAVFGAVYGHRFGDRQGPLELSVVARAGARSFKNANDGILDSGLTLAATRAVPQLGHLNVTGSAGIGAMLWGQGAAAENAPDTGRLSLRVPLSAGVSYDLRIGGATVVPFAAVVPTYSSERDYIDDERIAEDSGLRVGRSLGMALRFKETVVSLSGIHGERGMPGSSRYVLSAGMSW